MRGTVFLRVNRTRRLSTVQMLRCNAYFTDLSDISAIEKYDENDPDFIYRPERASPAELQ